MTRPSEEAGSAADAFWRLERSGALLGLRVRLAGLALMAAAIFVRVHDASLAWYLGILAMLAATGLAFYFSVAAPGLRRSWLGAGLRLALIALDMAIVTAALVVPAPTIPDGWPAAMQLRIVSVAFLFAFVVFSALTLAPATALWSGVAAAGAWFGGALWVLAQPGAFTRGPAAFGAMETPEIVATLTDPDYVSLIHAAQDSVLLVVAGIALAAAAWRARLLAMGQVEAARRHTALARYFSPDLAEELRRRVSGFSATETRQAAVLFADVSGFTALAEGMTPEETIAFLREFHRRATEAVFAHRGTLNKFIGDEVMASFGAIQPMPDAAAVALQCALDVARKAEAWSADREARGLSPVRIGVGLHVGAVVVGDIGDARCLELAVLGDTVNVANRLQAATREHGATLVVSRSALDAALAARPDLAPLAAVFEPLPRLALRGRTVTIDCAGVSRERLLAGPPAPRRLVEPA